MLVALETLFLALNVPILEEVLDMEFGDAVPGRSNTPGKGGVAPPKGVSKSTWWVLNLLVGKVRSCRRDEALRDLSWTDILRAAGDDGV